MTRCAIIEHCNECEHAKIGEAYYICGYKGYCAGKRPQTYTINLAELLTDFLQWHRELTKDYSIDETVEKYMEQRK